MNIIDEHILRSKQVMINDINSLQNLYESLDWDLIFKAAQLIADTHSIFVSGIGKSGLISKKIASTFASVGIQSHFLHPIEAIHGDIGLIKNGDTIILVSNSGNTAELLSLIPVLKIKETNIIGILGNSNSQLSQLCDISLIVKVRESTSIDTIPTTSSIATLAISHILLEMLISIKNITASDYSLNHPAGQIGRNLLMTVKTIMISEMYKLPIIQNNTKVKDIIIEMTSKSLGCAIILNKHKHIVGFITDGDIRRLLQEKEEVYDIEAHQFMTKNPITIKETSLLGEALSLMEDREKKIGILPVVNASNECVGIIRLHEIANNK
jgi:arabinose-5-phosphate isomerase